MTGAARPRWRPAVEIVVLMAWLVLVTWLTFAVGYRLWDRGWGAVGVQVVSTVVGVAPFVLIRPRPRWHRPRPILVIVGVVALAAAFAGAATVDGIPAARLPGHAIDAVAAGISEEWMFRGILWARLVELARLEDRSGLPRIAAAAAVLVADAVLFAGFHIPRTIATGDSAASLLPIAGFGLAFGLVRLLTARVGLPMALHVAVDLF